MDSDVLPKPDFLKKLANDFAITHCKDLGYVGAEMFRRSIDKFMDRFASCLSFASEMRGQIETDFDCSGYSSLILKELVKVLEGVYPGVTIKIIQKPRPNSLHMSWIPPVFDPEIQTREILDRQSSLLKHI